MLTSIALETLPEWPHPVRVKVLEHPGLLTERERGLLYWLARHHFTGEGSIVDAGIFLGASTRAFAAGLRDNRRALERMPRDRKPIASYDLGVFVEGLRRYLTREPFRQALGGWTPQNGDSFEPLLRRLLAEEADLFELRLGNLVETASADGPIEIAFYDCLKSARVDWAAFTTFAPHYIPGHTIVIQQDYFYAEGSEHRLRQESLSDCFHYLGQIATMAVFRLVRPIPAALFERDTLQDLSLEDELRLFEQAAGRTDLPKYKLIVRLSAAGHVCTRHGLGAAMELKNAIERDFRDELPRILRQPAAQRVWQKLNPDKQTSRRGVRELVTRARKLLVNRIDPTRYLECPCCGELATTFLPHGTDQQPNRRCPRCFSLERNRLQWLFLHDKTNLFRDPLKVLHFAPEGGLQNKLLAAPNLTYHGADLSSKRAAEHFDICAIPYPDDTFDVILCSHVLEHVPDDRKAMAELFRVMKPGGWGLIEVPYTSSLAETLEDPNVTTDEERTRLYGQKDHLRRYGRDYFTRLRSAGFEVVSHPFAKQLGPELVRRYRLKQHGRITIGSKPAR